MNFFVTKQPFGNAYKCILGYNLFRKFKTQFNLEGNYLRLNDAKVPILETRDQTVNNIVNMDFPVSLTKKSNFRSGGKRDCRIISG